MTGMTRRRLAIAAAAVLVCAGPAPRAQQGATPEVLAQRQLSSGRIFLSQGKFAEALQDFRTVAETYAATTVADDALLELARFYFERRDTPADALTAVDAIIKKYPTSNSAPDAHVLSGRLALRRSHQPADLDAALADFERVIRLFPGSDAVPRAHAFAGEALALGRRYNEALVHLGRVGVEYPTDPAAAAAAITSSGIRVALGDPVSAMEELQQVRNRWPADPIAADALDRLTLLHRLYLRTRAGAAYALTTDTIGPAKLENVTGVAASGGAIYWAGETAIGVAGGAGTAAPPAVAKARGLALDRSGRLVVLDAGSLRLPAGDPLVLSVTRPNGTAEPLARLDAAAQLSNGDWLVVDDNEKGILRYDRAGTFVGVFAPGRVTRLALNGFDETAALDRDQKAIVILDPAGKTLAKIPFKTTTYELPNPEDVAFDSYGHLYVLDRGALAIFTPFPPADVTAVAPLTSAPGPAAAPTYRLLTLYAEPERTAGAFRRATSFAIDPSGAAFLYDDRAQRILVYR
jgi:TolA-binding protein